MEEKNTMMLWEKVCRPPKTALKTIKSGRLNGMTDISPQWRYQIMTEIFGACGQGWKFEVKEMYSKAAADGVVLAFAVVHLFYKDGGEWSEPIPGVGGSTMVAKERNGMYSSDECFKMAVTDALSTAMKVIGVGADIYAGKWNGSKYNDVQEENKEILVPVNERQLSEIIDMLNHTNSDEEKFLKWLGVETLEQIPASRVKEIMSILKVKAEKEAA